MEYQMNFTLKGGRGEKVIKAMEKLIKEIIPSEEVIKD